MSNHRFASIRSPGESYLNRRHPLSPFERAGTWLGPRPLLVLLSSLSQFPILTAPILTEPNLRDGQGIEGYKGLKHLGI